MLQTDRHEKKMRESVFSKNICEGASERQNENIIVSLKTENFNNFKCELNLLTAKWLILQK